MEAAVQGVSEEMSSQMKKVEHGVRHRTGTADAVDIQQSKVIV
jgi:hypothetical protein